MLEVDSFGFILIGGFLKFVLQHFEPMVALIAPWN